VLAEAAEAEGFQVHRINCPACRASRGTRSRHGASSWSRCRRDAPGPYPNTFWLLPEAVATMKSGGELPHSKLQSTCLSHGRCACP
jgi:hypothetical protein